MIVVVTNMLSDVEWHDDRLGQGGVWVWQSARLKLVRGLESLTTPPPRHHPAPPNLYVAATSKGPRCCRREARLTRGRGVVGGLARLKLVRGLESGADRLHGDQSLTWSDTILAVTTMCPGYCWATAAGSGVDLASSINGVQPSSKPWPAGRSPTAVRRCRPVRVHYDSGCD